MPRRHEGSHGAPPPPEEVYRDLRSLALQAVEGGAIPFHEEHPTTFGLVVDIPADGGHATVVALGDNTTSIYTSTGGGTIGAGERPAVAAATQKLLAVVQSRLGSITGDDDGGLPSAGWVRLHVLTQEGLRSADVPEDAFWGRALHPLTPVIAEVQEVISQVRTVSP